MSNTQDPEMKRTVSPTFEKNSVTYLWAGSNRVVSTVDSLPSRPGLIRCERGRLPNLQEGW